MFLLFQSLTIFVSTCLPLFLILSLSLSLSLLALSHPLFLSWLSLSSSLSLSALLSLSLSFSLSWLSFSLSSSLSLLLSYSSPGGWAADRYSGGWNVVLFSDEVQLMWVLVVLLQAWLQSQLRSLQSRTCQASNVCTNNKVREELVSNVGYTHCKMMGNDQDTTCLSFYSFEKISQT